MGAEAGEHVGPAAFAVRAAVAARVEDLQGDLFDGQLAASRSTHSSQAAAPAPHFDSGALRPCHALLLTVSKGPGRV